MSSKKLSAKMFYLFLVLTLLPYILPIHINAINLMDLIHRSRERDQRQQGADRLIDEALKPSIIVTSPPPAQALAPLTEKTSTANIPAANNISSPLSTTIQPTSPTIPQQRVELYGRRRVNDKEPLNQSLVFGMLIGITCIISMCIYIFKPNRLSNPNPTASNSNSSTSDGLSRLFRIKEPFATDKPYKLNFDDRGLCYASPLPDNEIPPLPTYIEAVQMPQNSFLQKQRDSLTTSASAEDVESSPPGDTKQFSLSEEEEVSIV